MNEGVITKHFEIPIIDITKWRIQHFVLFAVCNYHSDCWSDRTDRFESVNKLVYDETECPMQLFSDCNRETLDSVTEWDPNQIVNRLMAQWLIQSVIVLTLSICNLSVSQCDTKDKDQCHCTKYKNTNQQMRSTNANDIWISPYHKSIPSASSILISVIGDTLSFDALRDSASCLVSVALSVGTTLSVSTVFVVVDVIIFPESIGTESDFESIALIGSGW